MWPQTCEPTAHLRAQSWHLPAASGSYPQNNMENWLLELCRSAHDFQGDARVSTVVMTLEIEDATCHPSRPPKAPPFAFADRPQFTVTRLEDTRSSMDLNMSNLDSRNPQNRSLHFHKFFWGGGRWGKGGGGIEGGGDLRTRGQG